MAEAILYGVAQTLIENLGSWAFQAIGLQWNVEEDLENIKNTVSTIQAILQDAAEQQRQSHQVKDWLEKLKDSVYEADDLLGEFYIEALRQGGTGGNITKKVCDLFRASNPVVFRREMCLKINAMRQKLNAIAEDRKKFHLKECHVESYVSKEREETHSFVPNEQVIGREYDKKAIIKLLLKSNMEENVSVVPIVGIGGLGKTTLVQYVYNDEIIKINFDLKMWVCVSDVFNVKIIVQKIIFAIGKKPEGHSMDQLQDQLRKNIDQKKYLLVLDDVWNEDLHKWDNLKNLLMGGAMGSRLVITTRIKLVADITSPVSIYTLNGLSEDQSWSLFKQIAFRKGQETNNLKLVEIGREIVRKCHGVPLAIKSIGSVLRFEETEHKWSYVNNNVLESVIQQESGIFSILKLSYDHLPSYLKGCFVFCSLFPKDYEIEKVTLIQLWVSQGFIQSSNKQLEDVADEYFKDLLWRSFFEEVTNSPGVYKMHDLIHDLAELVSGAECKLVDFKGKDKIKKIRHVSCPFSIDSSFLDTLKSLLKADKIRTFLLTSSEHSTGNIDESMLNIFISSLRSLRALDLHGLKITEVPNSVVKLIHLKYLDLSWNTGIKTLPDSLIELRNLRTLKLQGCNNLEELPRGIGELVSLKDLDNSGCSCLRHMPHGLGQITCLQTLPLFVVSDDPPSISNHVGGLGELNLLNSLRGTLEITSLEKLEDGNSESKAANLMEKKHLEKLILKWSYGDRVDDNDAEKSLDGLQPPQDLKRLEVWWYKGVRFSSWLSSLTNLTDLVLFNFKRFQYLPPLSRLLSLKELRIYHMEVLEYISDCDISEEVNVSSTTSLAPFLPSLKILYFQSCPNLKGWWRRTRKDLVATTSASAPDHQQHQHHQSMPSFPGLSSSFRIFDCPNLTYMPLFPYLEEELCLNKASLKPLQETLAMASSLPYSSSSLSSPLSKLKLLSLGDIEDVMSLLEEWPSNLNSLKDLLFWDCRKLTSLSQAMRYLTSLEELYIDSCYEFNDDDEGMEWGRLNCLRSLNFIRLQKLEYLPAGLQHVTTLQTLKIFQCPNLMTLPDWIGNLTSLETLEIRGCAPNMTSLPEWISCLTSLGGLKIEDFPNLMILPESISNLTSLHSLEIVECPNLTSLPNGLRCLRSLQHLTIRNCYKLEKKCKKEIGEDWPKIAHVPYFYA